jgi:hypothetical protein
MRDTNLKKGTYYKRQKYKLDETEEKKMETSRQELDASRPHLARRLFVDGC